MPYSCSPVLWLLAIGVWLIAMTAVGNLGAAAARDVLEPAGLAVARPALSTC